MKCMYYIWLLGGLLSACGTNDYKLYSGEACLQFAGGQDTVKRYTFYFQPAAVAEDTVWFEVMTTGYASEVARSFRVVQNESAEGVNAVEGVHYRKLDEMGYQVAANAVNGRMAVVLYRENLAGRTAYYLNLEIAGNEHFNAGEKTQLRRTVIFSKDLLKPDGWGKYLEDNVLGAYSVNKHEWMISQTGQKWDEAFFEGLNSEPDVNIYWRDKLNALLVEYRTGGGILLDDDKHEITGFPE